MCKGITARVLLTETIDRSRRDEAAAQVQSDWCRNSVHPAVSLETYTGT
ncbi:hypothetical protein ABZ307_37455 [Streptomyces griseorubiginosus]